MSVVCVALPGWDFSNTGRSGALRNCAAVAKSNCLSGDFFHLVEPAADNAHVVFDDARALLAELVFELRFDGVEERFSPSFASCHNRRNSEESALERDALHAELQLGVVGLFARNLERVHDRTARMLLSIMMLLELLRNRRPDFRRASSNGTLQDKDAAFLQSGQRIGVLRSTLGSAESTTST